jgi:imidazolonepropionase-like amidohydrolase
LLLRADRIVAAGTAAEVSLPPGSEVLDLGELVLVPGFIDAHVHLALGPAEEGKLSGADEARATLEAGFTTVRDLGSRDGADLRLQEAIQAGHLPGPRMLVAVSGIGPRSGICNRVFGEAGAADSAEEARARVRELAAAGAGVIKVCAGGGVLANEADLEACECDPALLEEIASQARELGLTVAAHAQGPAAIRRALRAGADSIEHGGLADPSVLAELADSGTFLVPTLSRIDYLIESAGDAPAAGTAVLRRARELAYRSARDAVAAGVPIAFGTDASVLPHGSNAREFRALIEIGLSPLEALRSATLRNAELIGWSDRVGALEPGLLADAVGLRGNPLEDAEALERVAFVMKSGKVVRSEP